MTSEADALAAIVEWLRGRPGVFVCRDEISTWQAAYRASGIDCTPALFRFQCRRAGFDIREYHGHALLDLSDGHLIEV